MVECRGNTKLSGELLDVFLFGLILATLAEFLDGVKFFLTPIPLVGKSDDTGCTLADSDLLTDAILLSQTDSTIAPRPRFSTVCASSVGLGDPGRAGASGAL